MVGTPYYISPEIVDNKSYSFKTDIWSLGVILYEMCALSPPFDGNSLHQLGKNIKRGKFKRLPNCFSQSMTNLIKKLLNPIPRNRPSIHLILSKLFQLNFALFYFLQRCQ